MALTKTKRIEWNTGSAIAYVPLYTDPSTDMPLQAGCPLLCADGIGAIPLQPGTVGDGNIGVVLENLNNPGTATTHCPCSRFPHVYYNYVACFYAHTSPYPPYETYYDVCFTDMNIRLVDDTFLSYISLLDSYNMYIEEAGSSWEWIGEIPAGATWVCQDHNYWKGGVDAGGPYYLVVQNASNGCVQCFPLCMGNGLCYNHAGLTDVMWS